MSGFVGMLAATMLSVITNQSVSTTRAIVSLFFFYLAAIAIGWFAVEAKRVILDRVRNNRHDDKAAAATGQ
jgi:hypothetical protein